MDIKYVNEGESSADGVTCPPCPDCNKLSPRFYNLGKLMFAFDCDFCIKGPKLRGQILAVIEQALAVSIKARREGLLALESLLDNDKIINRDIFHYGLRFVVDGTDYEVINELLSNLIKQDTDKFSVLLKTIQKRAVLSIQSGDNPRMLAYILNSYTDIPLTDPVFASVIHATADFC